MKFLKRNVLFLVVGFVLAAVASSLYFYNNMERYLWPSLVPPEYTKVNPDNIYGKTVRIEIGDRSFDFPLAYIGGRAKRSQKDHTALLVYMLPDFRAKMDFPSRAEYDKAFKGGQFGQTLVENFSGKTEFNLRIENLSRAVSNSYIDRVSFGTFPILHGEHWYRVITGGPNEGTRKLERDMYFEYGKNGKIKSYIQCESKESGSHVRMPGCLHYFFHKNNFYSVYYNRKNYFLTWQEQRRAAIDFIDNFELTN